MAQLKNYWEYIKEGIHHAHDKLVSNVIEQDLSYAN